MNTDGKKRSGIKVNLLPGAYDAWERGRGGYSRTVFATAAAAVLKSLPRNIYHEILGLAGQYDDGRCDWNQIENWVERQVAGQAEEILREADAAVRQSKRSKSRRKNAGG